MDWIVFYHNFMKKFHKCILSSALDKNIMKEWLPLNAQVASRFELLEN